MPNPTHSNDITNDDGATPPGGMHRPEHGVLDMEEVAAHDEVQHEEALRNATLRVPR